MSEDITKDPEYIRGYEEAKKSIEEEKRSAYRQGRKAAYHEEVQKEHRETEATPLAESTVTTESPKFSRELIDILREFIAIEQGNSAKVNNLDERLKNLERYTQE